MIRPAVLALLSLFAGATTLHSQAFPTASRLADAQFGGGYVSARPDYVQQRFSGFAFYGDLDFRYHVGIEGEFHQVNESYGMFERTYEIGGRYFHAFGPLVPYVKGLYGRGDFNYPNGIANLAYNIYALGGGADLKVATHIHVRGDYEFQKWSNFPNGGLDPQLITIGVAYHFESNKPYYNNK